MQRAQNVIVFENVRVLTMTEHGALDNATVVIRGGSISSVGGSVGDIPDGAVLIDGSGKTLMPGLADMHVHYWSNSQGPLYLANSVTTVRNPWGSSQNFVLDARSKDGYRRVAARLFVRPADGRAGTDLG